MNASPAGTVTCAARGSVIVCSAAVPLSPIVRLVVAIEGLLVLRSVTRIVRLEPLPAWLSHRRTAKELPASVTGVESVGVIVQVPVAPSSSVIVLCVPLGGLRDND